MSAQGWIAKFNRADLYRELGPSAWYLDESEVWADIQRFKLFGASL